MIDVLLIELALALTVVVVLAVHVARRVLSSVPDRLATFFGFAQYTAVVYFEDQDGAGALTNLAALADPLQPGIWPRDSANTDFLKPSNGLLKIFGIYAGIDATVQPRARLTAPSFREKYKRTALEIPLLATTNEPGSPPTFNDLRLMPIEVRPNEQVGVETLNNPAAAANQYVVLFVGDQITPVDPKSLANGYWIRCITTASALTADTWGTRTLTLDEQLLSGTYGVYGARVISTSLICARLNFPTQLWRPAVLGADARADIPHPSFALPGGWGKLGTLDTDNLPSVELLVDAADNEVQIVDLFVVPENIRTK